MNKNRKSIDEKHSNEYDRIENSSYNLDLLDVSSPKLTISKNYNTKRNNVRTYNVNETLYKAITNKNQTLLLDKYLKLLPLVELNDQEQRYLEHIVPGSRNVNIKYVNVERLLGISSRKTGSKLYVANQEQTNRYSFEEIVCDEVKRNIKKL
jgi:hypothetical protein